MKPRTPWMAVVKKKHLEPMDLILSPLRLRDHIGVTGTGHASEYESQHNFLTYVIMRRIRL